MSETKTTFRKSSRKKDKTSPTKSNDKKSKKQNISLFKSSDTQNYSIILKDKNDIKHQWKVKKQLKEDLFYNYPIDLFVENIIQLQRLMDDLAETKKIKIKDNQIYPKEVLKAFYKVKKAVKPYSALGEMLRTEYIKKADITLKSFPDSYTTKGNIGDVSSILYHRFIYHYYTIHHYYIIDKYNLLPVKYDPDFKILNISQHLGFGEACIFKYIKTTHNQLLNDMVQTQLLTYAHGDNYLDNDTKKMKQLYGYDNVEKIDKIWSLDELEATIEKLSGIDLCYIDAHMLLKEYGLIRTNYNHMLMLAEVIIAMGTLNKNGNLLMSFAGLSTKFSQDLIYIVNCHFDRVELFKTELQEPHYNTTFILASGFQKTEKDSFMSDMEQLKKTYGEMYDEDDSCGLGYFPNDPVMEKQLQIKHIKSPYKHFNSLLIANESLVYPQINTFNQYRLENYNDFLSSIDFYSKNVLNNKEKHYRHQMMHTHKSIQIANYLGLKINPYLDVNHVQTDMVNDVYRNLYGLDSTVYYRFRRYHKNMRFEQPKLQISNRYLLEQILRMENATRVFDTRKIENYDKLKKHLRFYEKTLNKTLMNNFNVGILIKNGKTITHPSRAWIKMYEIAEVTKLIPKKADNYKVFCFCEAPGNFILGINHFVKTKTSIKNFDWNAQSYNPNSKKGIEFHVIGDDYDLMKKYPDKWDFGPKNTGDITDPDNIKYYGSVYDDIDLLTSDCGTDWAGDDLISSKLMYGQLLFILNNLPAGKNFVIKYYMPFIHYPAQLALFYIIYQSFSEISFYKPLQNAWSHEFYLIGKGYKKLNDDQLDPLFKVLKNYNPYMSPINLDKLPDEFMKQIEKVSKDVVDRFVFYIKRYIYYLDLIEDGKKPDFDVVQNHIHIRNKEWLKEFKIKRIDNKDKL
jgi:hypothetical protein